LFQAIAFEAAKQDRESQIRLLDRFRQALAQQPENAELLTGEALLLHYLGDDERALQSINQALAADKSSTATYVLKANLLEKLGDKKAAAKVLRKRVDMEPNNHRLRLQYARLLSELDLQESQKQFQLLVKNSPMDPDLILAFALVSNELGDYPAAREHFEQLLFLRKHSSVAYFYLAEISEKQKDISRATELYQRVTDGEELLYAAAALCRIYLEQSQLDKCQHHMQSERKRLSVSGMPTAEKIIARLYIIEIDILHRYKPLLELGLLNEALEQFPDHADLRYARAMLYEQANNLGAAET